MCDFSLADKLGMQIPFIGQLLELFIAPDLMSQIGKYSSIMEVLAEKLEDNSGEDFLYKCNSFIVNYFSIYTMKPFYVNTLFKGPSCMFSFF